MDCRATVGRAGQRSGESAVIQVRVADRCGAADRGLQGTEADPALSGPIEEDVEPRRYVTNEYPLGDRVRVVEPNAQRRREIDYDCNVEAGAAISGCDRERLITVRDLKADGERRRGRETEVNRQGQLGVLVLSTGGEAHRDHAHAVGGQRVVHHGFELADRFRHTIANLIGDSGERVGEARDLVESHIDDGNRLIPAARGYVCRQPVE